MNLFIVQFIFLSLFSPAFCATGPTSYGGIQITPSILSPVNQYSSIPVSVKAVLANGTTDATFTSSVSLAGAVGSESLQFQDDFEGTVTYTTITSGGSTMSYDTSVYAAASTRSAKISGASSTNLAGPYYSFGADVQPVRYSMYMRSNSTTKLGPIVSMVELDFDYYTASNVLFDGSVGRIRMRRCSGSCTYVYSIGVPYVANQWYKIDVVIHWSTSTVDLYVDDILRDSNFPLMYGSNTYTMRGIVYYNYDKGVTGWVDNVKVISAEGNPTAVSISPTTIPLTNGVWNGNVQVLSSTASNTYLRALSGLKEGRSNTFSSRAGCTPGQASATYYSNCVACAAGTYSTTNGASGCTSCNPGTYQQSPGQTGCTNCSANQFNPNYGSNSSLYCQACPFPQISYPGSSSCSACKPGEYTNGPVCMGCPNGTYGTGGPSCTPCPAGTYNSLTNQSSCVPCPTGHVFSGTGAISVSSCTACAIGQYAFNSSLCLGCDAGTYNDLSGQTICTKCLSGTYNNLTAQNSSDACIPCPLGHHASLNGSTSCVPCDIGTYANVTGLTTCSGCEPGSAANGTGTINCTICTEGFHALNYGQDLCQPCDPGTASNITGEDVCPSCAPGYFSSSAGLTQCSKCVIGTFANETGTSICYNCPTNYTTATDGSDSSSDCILQCGDGRLQTGEFCDDHNHANGDGCSTECTIEPGYICLTPGQPCINQQTSGPTSGATTGGDGDGSGGGGSGKTSTTAIAAAAVGAIALVVCLVGIIVGALLYRRREKKQNQPPSVEMPAKVVSDMDSNYRRIPSVVMAHSPIIRGTYDAGSGEKIPRLSYSNQIHYNELDTHDSAVVGKGAFGVVFSAYWHGQKVAVKEIKSENISEDDVKKFIEEAELMRNLKPHANVVLFLGVVLEPFCIVTEFLECGDLHSFLSSDSKIPMDLQLSIIKDIARGMFHLALEGIVHRDLAARNVLLTRDFAAKVSDFGLSRIADADNVIYSKSDIGPLKWMAPEAIRRKKYSEKSDVFAFGVTCFEILSREEPYRDMDAVQVATAVVGEGLRPEIPHWTPPRLAEIVAATFETDPDHRPTFHQLIALLDTVDLTEVPPSN